MVAKSRLRADGKLPRYVASDVTAAQRRTRAVHRRQNLDDHVRWLRRAFLENIFALSSLSANVSADYNAKENLVAKRPIPLTPNGHSNGYRLRSIHSRCEQDP